MDVIEAFGSCPRCSHGVDYREQVTVCSNCGWMPEAKQSEKPLIKRLIVVSLFAALAFVHMVNWGEYSFEIISLKAKTLTGTASVDDLNRTAEICEDQLKYECAADSLSDKAWKTNQASDFKSLGDMRRRMHQWDKAVEAYEMALGKMEADKLDRDLKGNSYYGLAKSFDELGQYDMAENYYQKSIKTKPGVLQVTVTLDYARMLKKAGRTNDAKRVIASAEKRSGAKGRFDNLVDL